MIDWRKLHSEELHVWHTSPSIIRAIKSRIMRWAGHVARMEDRRGEYRVSVVKRERKRLLGRSVHRWENNIELYLEEIGCRRGVD